MNLGVRAVATVRSDEESFEALFTAEYARVAGIANRVLADRHEAEDVAQEVFIDFHRLHSASAQYAPAWLHRAAAHAALNRLLTPVEFVSAVAQVDVSAQNFAQAVRPVDHGRQRLCGGQPEPDHRGRHQALGLDHGIREVGGADHHSLDLAGL